MILQLNNTKYGLIKTTAETIKEAVEKLNTYVDLSGIGSSEMDYGFGLLVDENKHVVAEISYNGKIVEISERKTLDNYIVTNKGELIKNGI